MSLDNFQNLGKIADGAYSTVYKVRRHQDNITYALKQVPLNNIPQKQIQNAVNEVRILASISHPNIIGYREAFYDRGSKSLWYIQPYLSIIMEYADGGDLLQKIVNHKNQGLYFKEEYIWDIFGQVVNGLAKLHQLGILHRDMKVIYRLKKTANVFLCRNGVAKVGDLNVSKVVRKSQMCQTQTGTPYYASPQVWRDEQYDSKSDMWSLGCVLYQFINLKLPFKARDMEGLYKKISRGYYSRINKSYSEQFTQILQMLIKLDPRERISCRDLLNNTFLKKKIRKKDNQSPSKSVLLKTIKLTKNISYLTERLPKSNYTPIEEKYHYHNKSMSLVSTGKKKKKQRSYSLLPPLPVKQSTEPERKPNNRYKKAKSKF